MKFLSTREGKSFEKSVIPVPYFHVLRQRKPEFEGLNNRNTPSTVNLPLFFALSPLFGYNYSRRCSNFMKFLCLAFFFFLVVFIYLFIFV
jgi:hypothetical protein